MKEKKIFTRQVRLSETQQKALERTIEENPELTASGIIRRALDRYLAPRQVRRVCSA